MKRIRNQIIKIKLKHDELIVNDTINTTATTNYGNSNINKLSLNELITPNMQAKISSNRI